MGVASRLTTAGGGDIQSGIPLAPAVVDRNSDGTDQLRTESLYQDARGDRVVKVTTDAAGADTFTLSFRCDPDEVGGGQYFLATYDADGVFTTGAINDDDNAATIQTAIRAALPGTDLTVVSGDGPGPFYIIFDREVWRRRYPQVSGTGTGCTVTVSAPDPDDYEAYGKDNEIRALGESHQVSESDGISAPTIGTITVTDAVDEVQLATYDAGIDGGTIAYKIRGSSTGDQEWNVSVAELQAALDEAADTAELTGSAPTVDISSGAEVATIDLGDIGAGDTFKLTYDATESTALITYAATLTTEIQTAVDELLGAADEATVAKVDSNTYTVTRLRPGAFASTFTVTTVTGFTPLGAGGYTDGGKITTAAGDPVYRFTFENGDLAGRPVGGVFDVYEDNLTDGGVDEPLTLSTSQAGVLGSISSTYTENGGGDTVLAAAVNDATGKSYGFVGDATSPVAITSLPPGAYHLVLRTVEDGRVSRADSDAFTVASA